MLQNYHSILGEESREAPPPTPLHEKHRELIAEFIGTFVLVSLGLGLSLQLSLYHPSIDPYLPVWLGWGFAVMMGTFIASGISVFPSLLGVVVERLCQWVWVRVLILIPL